MKKALIWILSMVLTFSLVIPMTVPVSAANGDLLGTVTLPGNNPTYPSVAGTFDGTYYMTILGTVTGASDSLQVYLPPVGGNGAATLVATKSLVDSVGDPVDISALAWDPIRDMVWGGYDDQIWLIDIGDPTVSGDALTTWQFNCGVEGIYDLVDGLAYDISDDTLYYSPDVDLNVYHFSVNGVLLDTVTPKNAAGVADGLVSGVVVGSDDTLYIGRDGAAEIRRIDKVTGDFISTFATTAGRVEDLTCDPVTYAPYSAILAKDAYLGLYEAFEVEEGTCPLCPDVEKDFRYTNVDWGNLIFSEDFESDSGGFTTSGTPGTVWQWGIPTSGPGSAYSGTNVWGTDLAGNYPQCYEHLDTPTIVLPTGAELKFWHWYDTESSYDGLNIKISTDGGVTFSLITPIGGYTGTANSANPLYPDPIFTGHGQKYWEEETFDLSTYAGQSVIIRFDIGADSSIFYPGWYIDDVKIYTPANLGDLLPISTYMDPLPLYEDFEGSWPPTGWTIHNPGDHTWNTNVYWSRTNYAGSGQCADADSDHAPASDNMAGELWTPSFNLVTKSSATLEFNAAYNFGGYYPGGEYFAVDVSDDGGSTWTNEIYWQEDHSAYGPGEHVIVDLTPYCGSSNVIIRFVYDDLGAWDWWCEVDDVTIYAVGEEYEYYDVDVVVHEKTGKVKSTNPGQLYGVISITGEVSEVAIMDTFDMEFDVNPAHLGGGVEIIMVDPDGIATILTDEPGISADVYNDANEVEILIDLIEATGDPLPPGWTLMVYIKFKTAMKHELWGPPFDEYFFNIAEVYVDDIDMTGDPLFTVNAQIYLTEA